MTGISHWGKISIFGPFVEGLTARDLTAKQRKELITCIARCTFVIKNYPTVKEFKILEHFFVRKMER